MRVTVSATTPILPSHPAFAHSHVLPLSHLDIDPNLRVSFRYLRAYVSTNAHQSPTPDPVDVIATALSSALLHYYPLAGTLRRQNHRLEMFCAHGQGVPLIRATADCELASVDYLDNPDETFVEQLVPDPDENEGLNHPCILQVTLFECGGFTLGASIHHSVCDGLGATQFFNAVAELARGARTVSIEPVWDRASLLGPRNPPRIEVPIADFLSLEHGNLPYSQEVGAVVRECFPVTDDQLERFKSMLFKQSGSRFTAFEALGAYIWRAKVKASEIAGNEKVKFVYSTNIRKQLKPPLPVGYYGNGCVPIYVTLTAEEVREQPIWETAKKIQKSKINISDEYARSFIDFQEIHCGDGITPGKEVSAFTDWRHLGHSTVDFGWGGPVTVLPLSRFLLGSVEPCFFLPHSSATSSAAGFKVSVALRKPAMPCFREEMKKFGDDDFGVVELNSLL
ncbi:spermidine coumaroyl-CoA acyltransferase [Cucurbita pepo subsp. pepo]|uniref:spermidine coumaroyl-CoA acyltransferase n=1 Tax=Cucurbita pepo subsp. pepo TaxID=3664 RepID=UPI000C9D3F02|nr:spermidine coumaroyl-CoA acyltransferase [Cucurbita pepo subsp. pepo]